MDGEEWQWQGERVRKDGKVVRREREKGKGRDDERARLVGHRLQWDKGRK